MREPLDRDRLREAIDIFEVQRSVNIYPGEQVVLAAARAWLNATETQWCEVHDAPYIKWQWEGERCTEWFNMDGDCELVSALLLIGDEVAPLAPENGGEHGEGRQG